METLVYIQCLASSTGRKKQQSLGLSQEVLSCTKMRRHSSCSPKDRRGLPATHCQDCFLIFIPDVSVSCITAVSPLSVQVIFLPTHIHIALLAECRRLLTVAGSTSRQKQHLPSNFNWCFNLLISFNLCSDAKRWCIWVYVKNWCLLPKDWKTCRVLPRVILVRVSLFHVSRLCLGHIKISIIFFLCLRLSPSLSFYLCCLAQVRVAVKCVIINMQWRSLLPA